MTEIRICKRRPVNFRCMRVPGTGRLQDYSAATVELPCGRTVSDQGHGNEPGMVRTWASPQLKQRLMRLMSSAVLFLLSRYPVLSSVSSAASPYEYAGRHSDTATQRSDSDRTAIRAGPSTELCAVGPRLGDASPVMRHPRPYSPIGCAVFTMWAVIVDALPPRAVLRACVPACLRRGVLWRAPPCAAL